MLVAANGTRFQTLARPEKGHVSIGHLSHADPPKVIASDFTFQWGRDELRCRPACSSEPMLVPGPSAEAVPGDFGIQRPKTEDVGVVSNAVEPLEHPRLVVAILTNRVQRERDVRDVPARYLADRRRRPHGGELIGRNVDSLAEEWVA